MSGLKRFSRGVSAALASSVLLATVLVGTGQGPAAAAVTSVRGSACAYYARVGLFGGPQELRGCGQTIPPGNTGSASPSVALPTDGSGSATAITAAKPDGATAFFGPAKIFSGQYPNLTNDPREQMGSPPSGPLNATTQGTPTSGSVTSTAWVDPGTQGTVDPTQPRGIGPGPVVADAVSSTCDASASGVTGSTSITNGILVTTTDSTGAALTAEPVPAQPPVNYTRSGEITNVGDFFTVVYNQQIVNADGSLTVNAVHMYLYGPTAVGELVVGQATCGTTPSVLQPGDRLAPTCRPPYTRSSDPGREWIGVFDAGGIQSITNIRTNNVSVQVGVDPSSPYDYLKFVPGQTGPLAVVGTRVDPNLPGSWSFDATDTAGNTVTCRGSGNFPPTAANDSYSTTPGTGLVIGGPGVLANDSDPEGDTLTARESSRPVNGSFAFEANGGFSYTPNNGFTGTDSFTYTASDGHGGSSTATVSITVTPDQAFLLRDINPGTGASTPWNVGQLGNDVFFLTALNSSTDGLWKTDGTTGGTTLVKSFSYTLAFVAPPLTEFNGSLFFLAGNSEGTGLWKSDGTSGGTVLVKRVNPGGGGRFPGNFAVVGNTLFFAGDDGIAGAELWKTDGTAAGTSRVKDINPGTGSANPEALTVVGSTVFFRATDGTSGTELWTTDGTDSGTSRVKDINPGAAASSPYGMVKIGSVVFFTAFQNTTGTELWRSDGTDAGTSMVRGELNPGVAGGASGAMAAFGNALYFTGNDGSSHGEELWKTDGTAAGTVLVKDIWPGPNGSSPGGLTAVGNKLVLTAIGQGVERELWVSDGTDAGTVLVKDINPGAAGSYPQELTILGNTVYFTADDGAHGREPWKSDLTAAGTALVRDINPGTATSTVPNSGGWSYLRAARGTLFFDATDGTTGSELWRLTATLPNYAPGAGLDAYATNEDTPLTVTAPGVLRNDADPNGDALSVRLARVPGHGAVTLKPDGSFTYVPEANFNGTDNFTYTVIDGKGGSATGTVSVDVAAVNDAPVAGNDAYSTTEDTVLTVAVPGVLRNDSDVDGEALSATVATGPAHGTAAVNSNGSFTYTPAANFNGTDTFTYTASDGHGGTATGTVTITVAAVNDAPVAVPDEYHSGMFGVGVPAPGVLGNDTDADSDAMTVTLATPTTNGVVNLAPDGSFTYNPNFLYGGTDSFTYVVSDGHGGTATGTVTITVGLL